MESRCRVCQLRILDPKFFEFLFKEKRSLREYQRLARKEWKEGEEDLAKMWGLDGYFISFSSFRRHLLAGEKHEL